jgi:hypothetical protein
MDESLASHLLFARASRQNGPARLIDEIERDLSGEAWSNDAHEALGAAMRFPAIAAPDAIAQRSCALPVVSERLWRRHGKKGHSQYCKEQFHGFLLSLFHESLAGHYI